MYIYNIQIKVDGRWREAEWLDTTDMTFTMSRYDYSWSYTIEQIEDMKF